MSLILDDIELRILGVLIEKSLTQAGAYPMTINSIVLGANQKQNRDPVVELTDADVSRALMRLQHKNLCVQAPPVPGERSNKFKHRIVDVLHWDRRDQAVMAELMLRGRQTPGELRTHAGRMVPFDDLESVTTTLRALRDRQPPIVEELAREPGRSANRWRHLLGQSGSTPAPAAHVPTAYAAAGFPGSTTPTPHQPTPAAPPPPRDPTIGEATHSPSLADRVATLERRVDELTDALSRLRPQE